MTAHKDDTKDSKWIGDLFRKALRPSEYQWKHKSKIPRHYLSKILKNLDFTVYF